MFKKEQKNNKTKDDIGANRSGLGMNDVFGYLVQLDDCTILHKDGGISRYFKYIAPDLDSASSSEVDFHTSTWEKAFSFLGDGFMVEANLVSKRFDYQTSTREFPDLVSALIDDERRIQYQDCDYFENTYFLSVSWRPEQMMQSKLRKFAIDSEDAQGGFDKCLTQFDQKIEEYTSYLKRSLLSIVPLKGNELTSFLYHCISGKHQGLARSPMGSFLNSYLACDGLVPGFFPKIGDQFIKVLSIDDLPMFSWPSILDILNYFPVEYRWNNRFICLGKSTAKSYLKRAERNWSSKAIGVMGVLRESMGMNAKLDVDAQNTTEQIKVAAVESSAGLLGHGFYNSCVVLMHEDKTLLEDAVKEITQSIQKLDFKVRDENVNAVEAYFGSIPGHGDYNLRKMLVDTQYVAQAFPICGLYQGRNESPCAMKGYDEQPPLLLASSEGSRPFVLNLHVGDVGHTAILGPTGAGKTTLLALLMASHRKYPGSRIVVLDKDHSNKIPILALGGEYFDPETSDFQLGPLAHINMEQYETIERALDWLIGCCTIQGVDITPNRRKLLRESLERLSKDEARFKNIAHLAIQDPVLRETISSFNEGQYHKMLNGTSKAFSSVDIVGFEMSSLVSTQSDQHDLSIPIIKAIFDDLEESFNDGRPTMLILEEAWLYLRHPLFREKLEDWFKTLRKKNVAVVFTSQSLDDIVKSHSASIIQESCKTRIYLPNASVKEIQVMKQYQEFGLNDEQIGLIGQATPKQDYYYHSELGNRLFRLDLKAVCKAFLCVSNKDDQDDFNRIHLQNDSEWVFEWLKKHDLDGWVEFAKKHYLKKEAING